MNTAYVFRGPTPEDLPFIYSTWLRNYRYSSTGFTKNIDKDIYYEYHNLIIGSILNRNCRAIVCSDKLDPKVIYGYFVWEQSGLKEKPIKVVHYAYVKKAFRKLGIFKDMCAAASVNVNSDVYTHQTEVIKQIAEKAGWTCKYNPYLIS